MLLRRLFINEIKTISLDMFSSVFGPVSKSVLIVIYLYRFYSNCTHTHTPQTALNFLNLTGILIYRFQILCDYCFLIILISY